MVSLRKKYRVALIKWIIILLQKDTKTQLMLAGCAMITDAFRTKGFREVCFECANIMATHKG